MKTFRLLCVAFAVIAGAGCTTLPEPRAQYPAPFEKVPPAEDDYTLAQKVAACSLYILEDAAYAVCQSGVSFSP